MKDPLGIMGTETIFVMERYSSRNVLEEFENMDKFKAGVTRKTRLGRNWRSSVWTVPLLQQVQIIGFALE